jgi:hypothetical protein
VLFGVFVLCVCVPFFLTQLSCITLCLFLFFVFILRKQELLLQVADNKKAVYSSFNR